MHHSGMGWALAGARLAGQDEQTPGPILQPVQHIFEQPCAANELSDVLGNTVGKVKNRVNASKPRSGMRGGAPSPSSRLSKLIHFDPCRFALDHIYRLNAFQHAVFDHIYFSHCRFALDHINRLLDRDPIYRQRFVALRAESRE
jgi:hypothetical protein